MIALNLIAKFGDDRCVFAAASAIKTAYKPRRANALVLPYIGYRSYTGDHMSPLRNSYISQHHPL